MKNMFKKVGTNTNIFKLGTFKRIVALIKENIFDVFKTNSARVHTFPLKNFFF